MQEKRGLSTLPGSLILDVQTGDEAGATVEGVASELDFRVANCDRRGCWIQSVAMAKVILRSLCTLY